MFLFSLLSRRRRKHESWLKANGVRAEAKIVAIKPWAEAYENSNEVVYVAVGINPVSGEEFRYSQLSPPMVVVDSPVYEKYHLGSYVRIKVNPKKAKDYMFIWYPEDW